MQSEIFDNGWSLSIIHGDMAYCDAKTFEVAVIGPDGKIDYTHTNGDVLSYQTAEDIAALEKMIRTLK